MYKKEFHHLPEIPAESGTFFYAVRQMMGLCLD